MIDHNPIHNAVKEHYGQIARDMDPSAENARGCGCCGGASAESTGIAVRLYDAALLEGVPPEAASISLGCGDPIAIASLKPGETVLDLGSGGGLDCFLAARQVGPTGRVIGVDMTPDMLARANASKNRLDIQNVEFRQGQIEALPVEDATVDVVISNCVINLSPDKPAVFREIYRVLVPGGRIAISDIVSDGQISEQARADLARWSECVSGALDAGDYRAMLQSAGFVDVEIHDKGDAEEASSCCGTVLPRLFSARITGRRPA